MYISDFLDIKMDDGQALSMGSLELAYVGDAVYELVVRTWLCSTGSKKPSSLHKSAVSMVSANAQAKAAERILPALTLNEADIFRRGRNSKTNSIPKNADRANYQAATGLEALMGYLYLTGRRERLFELLELMDNGLKRGEEA